MLVYTVLFFRKMFEIYFTKISFLNLFIDEKPLLTIINNKLYWTETKKNHQNNIVIFKKSIYFSTKEVLRFYLNLNSINFHFVNKYKGKPRGLMTS